MDRRPGSSRVICSTRQPGIGQSLFILRSMGFDASSSKPQPRPAQSTQRAGEPSQLGTRPAESVGLPGYIEHLFAYFCTAAVLTLADPGSPRRRLMGGLIAYATLLEVGQLYVPGRAAQLPFIHGALLWVVWTVATRVTDAQARQADR